MGSQKVPSYTDSYKQQAVYLGNQIGDQKAAKQLGISTASIHNWRKKMKNTAVNLEVKSKSELEAEVRRLQAEVNELNKVNHILKQAAAFFSRDHLK